MASRSDPFLQYPPLWEIYDGYKDAVPPDLMGLTASHGDIVRFGARYRFARSFRGVLLEDVSSRTLDAYSALAHLMFTYGAFETFLNIQGLTKDTYDGHLCGYPTVDWLANIRANDPNDKVLRFCRSVATRGRVLRELDSYLQNGTASFVYIAFALRNAFAHGHLTGQVWGTSPAVVRHCAQCVTSGLFTIMDREWRRLMMELDAEMDSMLDPPEDAYAAWQAWGLL